MDEAAQTLAAWLSPGFPVGAFAYSHGLETAIAEGDVGDAASLEAWVGDALAHGSGRNDAILLAAAFRAPDDPEPAELARALAVSSERLHETEAQGAAFAQAVSAAYGLPSDYAPYPVTLGRAAARAGAPLPLTATLFLQAFAANLVSAAVRLIPLGQTEGAAAVARLAPLARRVALESCAATTDDLGGAALAADIAAMRHETLPVRLFRT